MADPVHCPETWSMLRGREQFVVNYEDSPFGIRSLVNAWREHQKRFDWWSEEFTDVLLEQVLVHRQIRRLSRAVKSQETRAD